MMATVPHVTSGLGLGKFQADGFLLTRVYMKMITGPWWNDVRGKPNYSGQNLVQNVQSGFGSHLAPPLKTHCGSFTWVRRPGREVLTAIQFRLRTSAATSLLPLYAFVTHAVTTLQAQLVQELR